MKQSTRDYFTSKRWAFDYMLSQECVPTREKGMPGEVYALIQEEFDPGYINDTQCPPCAFSIIKEGFRLFDQAVKNEAQAKPLIVAATFPKQEPTLNIPVIEDVTEFGTISEDGAAMNLALPKIKITSRPETAEETKARLTDPNRIIKRRAKRKK